MKSFVKSHIAGCLLLVAWVPLHAQVIMHVGSGGQLFISSNTAVSLDSLVLTPSTGVLITPTDIVKSTVLSHPATGTYISRVYQFSNPVASFGGTVAFGYTDDELNGLDENTLVLNAYTNNSWTSFPDNVSRDADNDYVTTSLLSGISLDELTLTSTGSVLPMRWTSVDAVRLNSLTRITWVTSQEVNCRYYQVQKSNDARSWQNVGSPIVARNSSFNTYETDDAAFLNGTAYYRIVMTNADGRNLYSTIVSVKDISNQIAVYPNPAISTVHVQVNSSTLVKSVQLYDASGKLLMMKTGNVNNRYEFTVSGLAGGLYNIVVETKDGRQLKQFMKP